MALTTKQTNDQLQVWLENPTEADVIALVQQIIFDRLVDFGFTYTGECVTEGCTRPALVSQQPIILCPACGRAQMLRLVGDKEKALLAQVHEASKHVELVA